jgi:NADP-dependent 3-hydroxy acid dehydrogenase YdfG
MKKTILITGTSSGIGKATAIHFQQKGWNVIATMRTPEKETELNKLENVQLERLDVLDLLKMVFPVLEK